MDARGDIYWSPTGNPRRKVYLDASEGVPVQDIWNEFRDAHNQNVKITGFPTEKNPDLLKRIIEASSNPGDLVLDCFAGSGTTLAVAEQLGRRWLGGDNSSHAIATILRRFAHGLKPMGDFVTGSNAPHGQVHEIQTSLFVPDRSAIGAFSLLADEHYASHFISSTSATLADVARMFDNDGSNAEYLL